MSEKYAFSVMPKERNRFDVVITEKARAFLDSRAVPLMIGCRIGWAEDGARVVIEQILFGSDPLFEYLRLKYPAGSEAIKQKTQTGEERRTLLYRLRYMLRCMALVSDRFRELDSRKISHLVTTLRVMEEMFRNILGNGAVMRLDEFISRLSVVLNPVNQRLPDGDAFCREVTELVDLVDGAFEDLRDGIMEKEREAEMAKTEIAALTKSVNESNRIGRRSLRMCERLVAEGKAEGAEDVYSRMAGLGRVNASQRRELTIVFRYSHEKYPVSRDAKSGAKSLRGLAMAVWRDHRVEFEALARLAAEPGYSSAVSLATKLYKIAAKYPSADHFRWA